jgi:hypothetical protein
LVTVVGIYARIEGNEISIMFGFLSKVKNRKRILTFLSLSLSTLTNNPLKTYCLRFYYNICFSEKFVCPENTLKCPESYCIEQRFLCDGKKECPGGEDEQECSKSS